MLVKQLEYVKLLDIRCISLVKGGGGGKGQTFREHDFEITCDPNFWSGFWAQILSVRRQHGGHAHFPAKKGPKNRNRELSVITLIS